MKRLYRQSADMKKGSGIRSQCGPETVSFILQAGHDYDTFMLFGNGTCEVRIRELKAVPPDGKAIPVLLPPQSIPVDDEWSAEGVPEKIQIGILTGP